MKANESKLPKYLYLMAPTLPEPEVFVGPEILTQEDFEYAMDYGALEIIARRFTERDVTIPATIIKDIDAIIKLCTSLNEIGKQWEGVEISEGKLQKEKVALKDSLYEDMKWYRGEIHAAILSLWYRLQGMGFSPAIVTVTVKDNCLEFRAKKASNGTH